MVPLPNHDTDWIRGMAAVMRNTLVWTQYPQIQEFLKRDRLNAVGHLIDRVAEDDLEKREILGRMRAALPQAAAQIQVLMAEADAGPLLRDRRRIGAEHIAVLADVKKKHSAHAVTADVDLAETARAAEFCGADGVIVTGTATGQPTAPADVASVKEAVGIPVLVGSGVDPASAPALLEHADALIVGSWYKEGGRWDRGPDAARAREMAAAVRAARG